MQYNSRVTYDCRRYNKNNRERRIHLKNEETDDVDWKTEKRIKSITYNSMQKVVISYILQKQILREFHIGHPVIRMKSLMHSYTYLPTMAEDIENIVKESESCQLEAKALSIKHQPWPKTDIPWTMLHIDYARFLNNHYCLIIVESFFKWPEIFKCRYPTSSNTVNVLKELFSRFCTPKIVVSDNGTQFTGRECRFLYILSIGHILTSACQTRSNGQADRFVDTFKKALSKNQDMDTEEMSMQKFLAVDRITRNPKTDSGLLPAELMFAKKKKIGQFSTDCCFV